MCATYKYIQNSCLHPTPPWAIPCALCPEIQCHTAGVGNCRPAGHNWPARNNIWPARLF